MSKWINEFGIELSVDAQGHEHKGKGPGGGQFTKGGDSDKLSDVISGKRKPTAEEYGELLDQGYEWTGEGFTKLEEISKSEVSESIDPKLHAIAKFKLSDKEISTIASSHNWEKTKPWNISKEELTNNPPSGFALTRKAHGEAAHFFDGTIHLSPKFFEPPYSDNEDARRHIVYHELGHGLADSMLKDGTLFQMHDAEVIPSEHDMGSGTGGGHGDEEALADAYALLHTDPEWLNSRYQKLMLVVIDRAKALGMPVPNKKGESLALSQWSSYILNECLREAAGDIQAGVAAANYILSQHPAPDLNTALSVDEGWLEVPDSFLDSSGVHLAVDDVTPPNIVIHNHIRQPMVTVNLPDQQPPLVNVGAPVINVPKPVVNVNPSINVPKQDAPVVNVSPPSVTVFPSVQVQAQPNREVKIKKDAQGGWVGEIKEK